MATHTCLSEGGRGPPCANAWPLDICGDLCSLLVLQIGAFQEWALRACPAPPIRCPVLWVCREAGNTAFTEPLCDLSVDHNLDSELRLGSLEECDICLRRVELQGNSPQPVPWKPNLGASVRWSCFQTIRLIALSFLDSAPLSPFCLIFLPAPSHHQQLIAPMHKRTYSVSSISFDLIESLYQPYEPGIIVFCNVGTKTEG